MAHVAEHHGEKEGEGDDGVGGCGDRAARSAGTPRGPRTPDGTRLERHGPRPAVCGPQPSFAFPMLSGVCTVIPTSQVRKLRLGEAKKLVEVSELDLEPGRSYCRAADPCAPPSRLPRVRRGLLGWTRSPPLGPEGMACRLRVWDRPTVDAAVPGSRQGRAVGLHGSHPG